MGLLAASLINALLAPHVSLGGRPCLSRFAVVPYSPFSDDGLNRSSVRSSKLGRFFYNLTLLYTSPQLYP